MTLMILFQQLQELSMIPEEANQKDKGHPEKPLQQLFEQRGLGGYMLKGIVVLILLGGFLLYRVGYEMDFTSECIWDWGHQFLWDINRLIDNDPNLTILLIGQIIMDICLPFIVIFWTLALKNIRIPMMFVFFHGMRTFYLITTKFPFPEHMAWRAPPFKVTLVPYDHTRDFFYSGHVGMAMMVTYQITHLGFPRWVTVIGIIAMIYTLLMVVSSRVHYTIDVVGTFVYLPLSIDLAHDNIIIWDKFWSLPYTVTKWIIGKCCCKKEEEDDNRLMDDNV